MNNDILTALKNAIEHGESLEKAARSFINAGYSASEVREAVSYLTSSSSMLISRKIYLRKHLERQSRETPPGQKIKLKKHLNQ